MDVFTEHGSDGQRVGDDFTVNEMLKLQRKLQEEYKDRWKPICPELGNEKLLFMVGEIGEVIDIVKKNGWQRAAGDTQLRTHLVEELADVLMYFNEVLLCYGVTAEELKRAYTEKVERNMTRWK